MPGFVDLIKQQFGRLTVLRRVENQHGHIRYLCLCACNRKVIVRGSCLKRKNTQSCGCLKRERTIASNTKHGHTKNRKWSKIYIVWMSMIHRCNNPNHKHYSNYGDRGITVCKRWKKFENFLEDMGKPPKGLQIDRIDNSKGYDKSNCHWVTAKQNCRNRRDNRLITHDGKTQCVAAWAEETGIHTATLSNRLKCGWSIEKALTTPIRRKK